MFSFRRKQQTPKPTPIPSSPSLPQLHSRGLSWPQNLVDTSSIEHQESEDETGLNGASRITFGSVDHGTIPFHKPSRMFSAGGGVSISSMYMSSPPSAFDRASKSATAPSLGRSQRRARAPPTFNLMAVGAQGTGKTALLRLLLETADLSPSATVDQRAAVDKFLNGIPRKTQAINTACAEICESRFDRVLFSVIDTPGLDFSQGKELTLERQVNTIVNYIDTQYADTMSEESKVIRKSKGDQHIHLCIYMIDPDAITSPAADTLASSLPKKTQSETTLSQRNPPDLVPDTSSGDETDEDEEETFAMTAAELKVIRRLSAKVNVLPVIAKADYLTDEKLTVVKEAIRVGLADAGLGFGVFGSSAFSTSAKPQAETPQPMEPSDSGHTTTSSVYQSAESGDTEEIVPGEAVHDVDEPIKGEERGSRPVIKLRASLRSKRSISRSRSRRDLSQAAEDDRKPTLPDATDPESIANIRFSAQDVASTDLDSVLPFALISPETSRRRKRSPFIDSPVDTAPASPTQQSEEGQSAIPHSTGSTRTMSYSQDTPADLKGVFVRKFRWGTVDVLNPAHCDFAALRTAILTTHLKVLKTHTKEVLYEKYRTEKLLVYRATAKISEEEKRRLLADMGL